MAGCTGYAGGMAQFIADIGVPPRSYKTSVLKNFNVWYVSGNRLKPLQYAPKHFVHSKLDHAVTGGANRLMCLVRESSQTSYKHSAGITGDRDDVARFFKESVFANGLNPLGHYYKAVDPYIDLYATPRDTSVKTYMEFDVTDCKTVTVAYERVHKRILLVQQRLEDEAKNAGVQVPNSADYVIAYGARPIADGLMKHSFHVVFYHHRFPSADQLKGWIIDTFKHLPADSGLDLRAHSNRQLMRMPWCGKENDVSAVLLPSTFALANERWVPTTTYPEFDTSEFHRFNICAYHYEVADLVSHHFTGNVRGVTNIAPSRPAVHVPAAAPVLNAQDAIHSADMLNFFKPLIPRIQEAIQSHRKMIADYQNVGAVSTAGNVSPLCVQPSVGIYHYTTSGDMFCEYDEPNHTHTSGGHKTTIQLNLIKGTYNQMCYVCQPRAHDIRYYSLFDHDAISISLYTKGVSLETFPISKDGLPAVFVEYFKDDLIYNHNLCDSAIVYNEEIKVWIYVDGKVGILNRMKGEMKAKYVRYTKARYYSTLEERRRLSDKKERKKINKEGQGLGKPTAFEHINKFAELVTEQLQARGGTATELDVHPELVPLKDGQCFNVFTGCLQPMKKTDYFTSRMNAVYKEIAEDEENVAIIDTWFSQLASAREDLATYHKRVDGLCMTFLPLDRKYYVDFAPDGSNGKSEKIKVQKAALTDTSSLGQNRHCELNQSFFSLSATSKATAGGPRADWMMVPHKTLCVVEEMPAVKMDVDIMKKFGSHDSHQARNLYKSSVMDIKLRGHLVINTNHALDLGDDTAIWDRTTYIPWNSVWVQLAKDVDHAKHRYLRDQSFVNSLHTKLDTYVSVCLRALSAYLKPWVVDGVLTLSDMAVPACVAAYTEEFKNKAMAVQVFIRKCMRAAQDHDDRLSISQGYTAYSRYQVSIGATGTRMDEDTFRLKLIKHRIPTIMDNEVDYFVGRVLNDIGGKFINQGQVQGTITQYAMFNPASKRQSL